MANLVQPINIFFLGERAESVFTFVVTEDWIYLLC